MSKNRVERLSLLFDTYDSDGDGELTAGDFELRASVRISEAGVDPDSTRGKRIHSGYMSFWRGMEDACDLNANGIIVRDEWFAAWDEMQRVEPTFTELPGWVKALADAIWASLLSNAENAPAPSIEATAVGGLDEAPYFMLRDFFGGRSRLERDDFETWWVRYLFDDRLEAP